jgi:vitamin B12/bleomycin/antimicrobial peptide transport system ATP-binding/permease protein
MNRQPIEDVVAETGKTIDAPPPEILEADPELSPDEAEQIRRDYLLKRFWISAKGFWGAAGGRLAWILTGGLLVLIILQLSFQFGINLWNRAIFDAIEKRDAAVVLHLTAVFFPLAIGSVLLGVFRSTPAWASRGVGGRG